MLAMICYLMSVALASADEEFTAVIIEPREHRALGFVLKNALDNLDGRWTVKVFHGRGNKGLLDTLLANELAEHAGRVVLEDMGVDNLAGNEYNDVMYGMHRSFYLYDKIPTEVFLVFQTDSVICSANKDLINEFIEYEYSGAPWRDGLGFQSRIVGNGGFSLRRKSKMMEVMHKCSRNMNEDWFFSQGCREVGVYKPSFEQAKRFSIETQFSPVALAHHSSWKYHNADVIALMEDQCPEYRELRSFHQ